MRVPRTDLTLVLGGTGKTGRRVAKRLWDRGVHVRIGSRCGAPPFDWNNPATWADALRSVASAYVVFHPHLGLRGAATMVEAFTELAVGLGVRRLVLLSARGEEEARLGEEAVQASGVGWTIVRSSWLAQSFSEGFFREPLRAGGLALPAGDVGEPFVDAADVAEVAAVALTEDGHAGRTYEVTGPRLLTFADAVAAIAGATGRPIRFERIPAGEFEAMLARQDTAPETVELLTYLFTTVLDGRNAHLCDGVRRALGRPPRDFNDYVRQVAGGPTWQVDSR
jgi:uncharacterized protein YbjT (DUF2867 family)